MRIHLVEWDKAAFFGDSEQYVVGAAVNISFEETVGDEYGERDADQRH
jgi:hypothetical protein